MKFFPINFMPSNLQINFMGSRNLAFIITCIIVAGSCILFFSKSLNYGIDFTGGLLIEVKTLQQKFSLPEIRTVLNRLNIGEVSLQNLGSDQDLLIKIGGKNNLSNDYMINLIKSSIDSMYKNIEYRKIDYVGPQIGKELITNGIYATIFSFLAIYIYIWLRFKWQFSLGLICALVHDTIATIGFMSFTSLEFNLTSIAAILTVIGYSVNDSVVIYDRIRENIFKYQKKDISTIINLSLNETLSRTILTISTTLLATLSLILFAGEAVKSFSWVVFVGIIIGTYSSIYISAPILIYFNLNK